MRRSIIRNTKKTAAGVLATATLLAAGCGKEAAPAQGAPGQPGQARGAGGGPGGGGQGNRPPENREPVAVQLAPVRVTTIPETVDAVGTLYGEEESNVSAKVEGRVVKVAADLGDRVADGAVLAQIDPTDFQLQVERGEMSLRETLARLGLTALPDDRFDPTTIATVRRAQVQADNAKAKLERARQLFQQQPPLISPQDFADIETGYAVAQRDYDVSVLDAQSTLALARSRAADLAVARQQLRDATVRAPGDPSTAPDAPKRWAVAQRMTSEGELVRSGTLMYRLVVDQPIEMRGSVPERFVERVKVDQEATLTVEGSDRAFRGKVTRVSPVVDMQSRTFGIEVTVANEDRALRPGAFARARVTVGQRPNVAVVPESALYSFAGIDRVFSVTPDGKAKAHVVRVLERRAGEILLDLAGVERVAVSNVAKLADGIPVKEGGPPPTTGPAKAR